MKTEIVIPTSLSEIPLKSYQEFMKVVEKSNDDEFIGQGLQTLDQIGISKRSLDVVFGGDFNIPIGPYVAIGVAQFQKRVPLELDRSDQ